MNKRQKKKLFKQTLIKVRKLHPQKGDVICFQPDLDRVDAETMCQFMKVCSNNDIFGELKLAFVPADIKQLKVIEGIAKDTSDVPDMEEAEELFEETLNE